MTSKGKEPDIGRRLAAARLDRGFSQASVARLASLAPSYLSRIETGKVHPTLRTTVRIASALRISLDDMLGVTREAHRRGACPVTRNGICLMDLTRAATNRPPDSADDVYTPGHLRLLRRFNELILTGPPELMRSLEVLLGLLLDSRPRKT